MFGARYFGARYFGARYFGKEGLTVQGYYFGARHFANSYFGQRYFGANTASDPFEIVETTGLSLTGALLTSGSATFGTAFEIVETAGLSLNGITSLAGNLTYPNEDFSVTAPLELSGLVGTLSIECNLEFGGGAELPSGGYWGRRYWGASYFGQKYFGTGDSFAIVETAGVGLTGTLTATSDIAQAIVLDPSAVGLTGSLGVAGDLSFVDQPVPEPEIIGNSGGWPQAWQLPRRKPTKAETQKPKLDVKQIEALRVQDKAQEVEDEIKQLLMQKDAMLKEMAAIQARNLATQEQEEDALLLLLTSQ